MHHGRHRLALFAALSACSIGRSPGQDPGPATRAEPARDAGLVQRGVAWHEISDAKAATLDAGAAGRYREWNKQLAEDYRREGSAKAEAEARKRRMAEPARKQYLSDREARLRARPTPEDIRSGDALNAMLADLSAPTLPDFSWRAAVVPLPAGISIDSLAFVPAPRPGAKGGAAAPSRIPISPGRLDMEGRWPDFIPVRELGGEVSGYDGAYREVRAQCLAGRLEPAAIARLDASLKLLKGRVAVAVPADRGYRAAAVKYVDSLIAAARMFDAPTVEIAREIVADAVAHKAATVGELLAFMRKFRLMFPPAGPAPGGETHARLYDLLKEQGEALVLRSKDRPSPPAIFAADGTALPGTRPAFFDDFGDPKTGWPVGGDHGYASGRYFVGPFSGTSAWNCPRHVRSAGTLEVVGIMKSAGPPAQGTVQVHVSSTRDAYHRGFSVKIDAQGRLFVDSACWSESRAFREVDPRFGPVLHRSIRPSGRGNKITLVLGARSAEIYVNSAPVCDRVNFEFDLLPAYVSLGGTDGPVTAPAEFDSLEIREFAKPADGREPRR